MRLLKYIIPVAFLVYNCGIYPQSSDADYQLKLLDKLLGEWHSDSNGSLIIEYWDKVSTNTLEGYGKTINESTGETKSYESLRIVVMSGEVFYMAKVAHNEFPVPFKLVEHDDSLFVFENKTDDFPKIIEYNFLDDNHINVKVGSDDEYFIIHFTRKDN